MFSGFEGRSDDGACLYQQVGHRRRPKIMCEVRGTIAMMLKMKGAKIYYGAAKPMVGFQAYTEYMRHIAGLVILQQ